MADGKTHKAIGAAAGTVASLIYNGQKGNPDLSLIYAAGGLLGGILGGKLPDIIDRPDTPNHRSFGHSVALVGISAWTEKETVIFRNILAELQVNAEELDSKGEKFLAGCCHFIAAFMIGIVAGYGSHLALDMFGKKGLPLLC